MPDSDRALLERWIAARDAEAFADIVSRHAALVYSTCKRITRNATEAEDVAQECFIELARVRRVIAPSLAGWLYRVAVRRSLDQMKSESRRKRREARYMETMDMSASVTWDDIQAHVDEAIAALPEKLREPIVYRFLEGQTHEAIARTLGISDSTVQYRLNRGIEQIKKFLKRRGVVAPTALLGSLLAKHLAAEAAPVALTTALGKLAIAGAAGAIGSGAAISGTNVVALGGLLAMKKAVIITALVVVGGAGIWVVGNKQLSKPIQPPTETNLPGPTLSKPREEPVKQEQMLGTAKAPEPEEPAFEQGASISGRVVDTDGNRVAGATVRAVCWKDDLPHPANTIPSPISGDISSGTDAKGNFEIADLAPGTYVLHVIQTPSATLTAFQKAEHPPITVKAGEVLTDLELIVKPGDKGSIEGYARDDEGNAVADAGVTGSSQGAAWGTKTDDSGHYRLEDLAESAVDIGFWHNDYVGARLTNVVAGTSNADVVMLRTGGISGAVVDATTRAPLERFDIQMVNLIPRQGGEAPPRTWKRAAGLDVGQFALESINPGVATFRTTADGYLPQEVGGVMIEPGKVTTGVTFYLSQAGSIEGYVTRNGAPIVIGASVKAFPVSRPGHVQGTSANESGFYRLESLTPDVYTVTATAEAEHRAAVGSGSVQVPAGRTVRLDFELAGSATVTGTVSWPQGYTVPVVLVRSSGVTELVSFSNLALLESQCVGYSLCGDGGRYMTGDLPPGSYSVTAFCGLSGGEATDLLQESQTVTLREGQTMEANFSLEP